MTEEIGEELTPDQLKPRTVVALRASHKPNEFITAWFEAWFDDDDAKISYAAFQMGEIETTLLARVRNGKLFDDMNHQIHVYRYKGEA